MHSDGIIAEIKFLMIFSLQANGNRSIYHYSACQPPGVKRGFIQGKAIRLLRKNSSKTTFELQMTPQSKEIFRKVAVRGHL